MTALYILVTVIVWSPFLLITFRMAERRYLWEKKNDQRYAPSSEKDGWPYDGCVGFACAMAIVSIAWMVTVPLMVVLTIMWVVYRLLVRNGFMDTVDQFIKKF